jgi:hypothetical protein
LIEAPSTEAETANGVRGSRQTPHPQRQSASDLSRAGKVISRGYFGFSRGENNPTPQAAVRVGHTPSSWS